MKTFTLLTALFGFASAASTLSTGKNFVQEKTNNGDDLTYQSSGIIKNGCNGSKTCYDIQLANSGMDFAANPGSVDPSSRQRVEFLTDYATENDGQSWKYCWTSTLGSDVTLQSGQWLHTWQLFSDSGAFMKQTSTGKTTSVKISGGNGRKKGKCSGELKFKEFAGQTFKHEMKITYGTSGSVNYTMKNSKGKTVMSCNYQGYAGSGKSYLKAGVYRSVVNGMSSATATIADFEQQQL